MDTRKPPVDADSELSEAPLENELSGLIELAGFPSWRLIITLYCFGALLALAFSFSPTLSVAQSSTCLFLAWIQGISALGISIITEWGILMPEEEDDYYDRDDWDLD